MERRAKRDREKTKSFVARAARVALLSEERPSLVGSFLPLARRPLASPQSNWLHVSGSFLVRVGPLLISLNIEPTKGLNIHIIAQAISKKKKYHRPLLILIVIHKTSRSSSWWLISLFCST